MDNFLNATAHEWATTNEQEKGNMAETKDNGMVVTCKVDRIEFVFDSAEQRDAVIQALKTIASGLVELTEGEP